MDVRASENPVLVKGRRWLDEVNARHPWNHNDHFHGWILRNLPAGRHMAIDVGCGSGVLARKLAAHFTHVTAIDADDAMSAAAVARLADVPRVSIRHCSFAEFTTKARGDAADLITMVAVLHHLDLDDTLARIRPLLAPGGRLLVVGLARVDSLADLTVELLSAAANPAMGLIKHPRAARATDRLGGGQPVMPVRDPAETLDEIKTAARRRLPGVQIRRRLFFRYTLRWDKPM
jgi:SAM-dependent methyltransferase